jgi:S1-C subfamily serine protease
LGCGWPRQSEERSLLFQWNQIRPRGMLGIRDDDFIVAFNGVSVESSDDLFKMLTEEKIGMFQDVTVIRHDKKIDLRVTPVEVRMRA